MIVRNSGYRTGSILCAVILALITVVPTLSSADEPDTATPSKVTANSPAVRPSVMDRHAWLQNGVPQFSAHVERLYEALAAGEIETAIRGARKLADVCAEGFGPDRPRTKLMRLLADSFGDLERLDPEQRKIVVSATQSFLRGKTLLREKYREGAIAAWQEADSKFGEVLGNRRVLAYPCITYLAELEIGAAEFSRAHERLDRLLTELTPPQEGTESLFGHVWILKGNLGLVEDSATAAEEAFRKSITILKPLALAEPNGPFAQDYARGCYSVSILLNDRNESGESLQFAREALQQQLVFDPENRLLALGVQIEIARSLSRLRRTTEADLVFMGIIRQLTQLPMSSEKQPPQYSHILLRCWVAHVEHQRLCGRDELAATQQAAIEAYIQRPMCGIALGKFQEVTRPDFVTQPQTAAGIYPQVFAKVIVETALETVNKRYMEQMVLGRTEEALATARLGLREASKRLSPDDWSLAGLTQFARTCEETLRLPEKSQQLVTEAFRLQALSLRSPNPRDMVVATRDSVSKIEEAFSPNHPHALLLRFGLATHEFKSGDLKAAHAELAGIAEPLERAFGTASPLVAEYWLWSARAEQLAGEPVIAEQLARRALAILEPLIVREGDPKQIVGYVFGKSILAEIHRARGEFETALELTWQVSDLLSIVNAPFVDRADNSLVMAHCLVQSGRLEEATVLLDRLSFSALAQMKNKRSPCPPQVAFGSYATYAQHLRQTGQTDEADALQRSLDLIVQSIEKNQSKRDLVTPAAGVVEPPSASSKR